MAIWPFSCDPDPMSLEHQSATPLYLQLADHLRQAIATGQIPPGAELPSEATLAYQHGRGTPAVRRALAVLRSEGLIATVHGRPSWVRQLPPPRELRLAAADTAVIRIPSDPDRRRLGLDHGVAIIEVHRGDSGVSMVPAEGVVIRGSG